MKIIQGFLLILLLVGCQSTPSSSLMEKSIELAINQLDNQIRTIEKSGELLNPKTISPEGNTVYIPATEWTSGFFPGQLWLLYELTGDTVWEKRAKAYTEILDSVQYITNDHDVGFMIGCSYGNAYRLGPVKYKHYENILIQTARSLSTRYNPIAETIQSWEVKGWIVSKGWKCPVIIDNLMNLEILFQATELTGDSTYYHIAVAHGETTLKNHFREDYSCYHVVDYDPETGKVLNKHTAQGYDHESVWSRGQAWAIYGYTMMYSYTKNETYLEHACHVASMMLNHPNMPEDLIPYWDMQLPDFSNQPRDVSSACIMATVFYELSLYKGDFYKETADKILTALSNPPYSGEPGGNNYFLLKHSVGSIPHGNEIDVPLNYADYYYLEAIVRKKRIEECSVHQKCTPCYTNTEN